MTIKVFKPLLFLLVLVLLGGLSLGVANSWSVPQGPFHVPAQTGALSPSTSTTPAYAPGRVLVRLRSNTVSVADVLSSTALASEDMDVENVIRPLGVYVLRVAPGHEMDTVQRLRQHPLVRYAEPDYIYRAHTTRPNDTYYNQYQWQLPHIGAETAWDTTTGDTDITVAVLDTGVDLEHPELSAKVVSGYDFINNDADPNDDQGHGTHVAGIIAATTNNGVGIAGISWGARIMPVKVLNDKGSGSTSAIANGVTWAVDHGADVINMSLGGEETSSTLKDAITYAYNAGVLVVASSGNSYEEGNPVNYPAAYDHVLAVAATDDEDRHASYSSSGSYVDVAAPGGDPSDNSDQVPEHWILSTYMRSSGSSYAWLAGTSQAAPHVSGLAALLLSLDDTLTPDQLTDIIESTAVDVESPGWDELTGYGRIDMAAAVAAALATPTPSATPTSMPTSTPTPTPTVTPGNTWTPTPTQSPIPSTSTPTPTPTAILTLTSTPTQSPIPNTPTPTATAILTSTPSPTASPGTTPSPTVTATPTATPTVLVTPTRYPAGDDRVNHATNGIQDAPAVAVNAQGNVIVAWHDGNLASQSVVGSMRVPYSAAWTADQWIGDAQPGSTVPVVPAIAIGPADKMALVWHGSQSGDSDIYLAQGNARTNRWDAATQINDDLPQPTQQHSPDVAIGPDGTLYVVWVDNRRGTPDIFWTYKKRGESAWRPAMPVQGATGPGVQTHPAIAVDEGHRVYIVWADRALGQLRLTQFDVSSQRWGSVTTVGNGFPASALPTAPTLVVEGGRVHVLWQDRRNVQEGPDIYHSMWVDNAWTPPQRVNSDRGNAVQAFPAAASTPDGLVAVWEDARDGTKAIYMAWWTPDRGWVGERRVGSGESEGVQTQPQVATDADGNAFIVWTDGRDEAAATNIYFHFVPYTVRFQIHLAFLSNTATLK